MADNGSPLLKQRVRHQVIEEFGAPRAVLELFAGEGNLYATCWRGAEFGITMDRDLAKVQRAAAERQGWLCVRADSEKAILSGIGRHTPFEVVDIDAYGEPWSFLLAWFRSHRLRADRTVLVLTDGFMDKRNMSGRCEALFPGRGKASITDEVYLETAQARARGWAAEAGLSVASFRTFHAARKNNAILMRQHVIVVEQPAGGRWVPPADEEEL